MFKNEIELRKFVTELADDYELKGDRKARFINQVVDREYERSSRGSISPRGGQAVRNVLPEGDELYKWLTIAGLK